MSRYPLPKRRRLSPPDEASTTSNEDRSAEDGYLRSAARWDLEQGYEHRPRKSKKTQKESSRLPIKTPDGLVKQNEAHEDEAETSESAFTSDEEQKSGSSNDGDKVTGLEARIPVRQQILNAKEELARIASLIIEEPEEHIGSLRKLGEIGSSANITVQKLAIATQLAVYKDIIPGYRIRQLSHEDKEEKVSKEVRRLRSYEQTLVREYQAYIENLRRLANYRGQESADETRELASVAISCACTLLNTVPHFNFRDEILKILVGKLSGREVDGDFSRCRETLEALFEKDEDGAPSLAAVAMLTKMIKGKSYRVDESVLITFLHLRLLSEFSAKGSYQSIDRHSEPRRADGKKFKQKREFRTKNQRKFMRGNRALEKEMKEAEAVVSQEERDRMQAETLRLVFVTYFHILQARVPSLMGAVLEGLAKYAHLINQDFFGDILEALKELINHAEAVQSHEEDGQVEDASNSSDAVRSTTREALLCTITAFTLLQGQDASAAASTLQLDLSFFITHLYRALYAVCLDPDIELSAQPMHLRDPQASEAPSSNSMPNQVNVPTIAALLIRSLSTAILPSRSPHAVSPLRIAAFSKQILTATLHLPEKSCVAMMSLMNQVTKVHGRKIAALWSTEETKGDGVFDPLNGEVEGSNPFAATVWEGEILRRHYSPAVREGLLRMEEHVLDAR